MKNLRLVLQPHWVSLRKWNHQCPNVKHKLCLIGWRTTDGCFAHPMAIFMRWTHVAYSNFSRIYGNSSAMLSKNAKYATMLSQWASAVTCKIVPWGSTDTVQIASLQVAKTWFVRNARQRGTDIVPLAQACQSNPEDLTKQLVGLYHSLHAKCCIFLCPSAISKMEKTWRFYCSVVTKYSTVSGMLPE